MTAEDVSAGQDPQNIPWHRLQVSRQRYRVSCAAVENVKARPSSSSRVPQADGSGLFRDSALLLLSPFVQETRLEQYHNYVNLREVVERNLERLRKESIQAVKVSYEIVQ